MTTNKFPTLPPNYTTRKGRVLVLQNKWNTAYFDLDLIQEILSNIYLTRNKYDAMIEIKFNSTGFQRALQHAFRIAQ